MKPREIKVKVEFTPGYQKRYTEALIHVLERRELKMQYENAVYADDTEDYPAEAEQTAFNALM